MSTPPLSRRRFIAASAVTAAGSGLSVPGGAVAGPSSRRRRAKRVDVAVVGAGLSGMAAAFHLHRAGVRSIVVFEAGEHIGGRTLTRPVAGHDLVLDLGAQFVGPKHTELLALAAELGVQVERIHNEGENLYRYDGRTQRHDPASPPPASATALVDFAQAQLRFEALAAEVPPDDPLGAPRAAELDAQTVETWIAQNMVDEEAKALFRGVFALSLAIPPRAISLLYGLAHTRANAGMAYLFGNVGGAQDSRFAGGAQQLAVGLAEGIGRRRVVIDSPVSEIDQTRPGKVVLRSARMTVEAKHVICAFTLGDAARIRFLPDLPVEVAMAQKSWPFGTTASKFQLVYDRPFWRDDGLTGQWTAVDLTSAGVGWDNSPPGAGPGVLLTFLPCWRKPAEFGAPEAVLNDPAVRRQTVIDEIALLLGPKARSPTAVVERQWHAIPYIGGVESPLPPGFLSMYGHVLGRPLGRVHWAGSETAHAFDGYMEGAVRAGRRAAAEVEALL